MMEFWLRKLYCTATAAVDVMAGGGDAGGGSFAADSGGGADNSGAGGEPISPVDSGAGADGVSLQPNADDTQLVADPNADQLGQDGRLIPQKYRELFKADKELKNLWFSHQAFRKEVPGGLNEVRQLKQFHQNVGGEDGLQQLQAVSQELEAIDAKIASGDATVITDLASENPESFNKLMLVGVEQWAKSAPEDYQHVMARVMVNTLNQTGAVNVLNQLQSALASGNVEQATQLFDKFANWYQGIEGIAAKQPEKKIDPEREKFNQEKQAFNDKKTREFQTSVATEVKAHYTAGFEADLGKEFKARGLDLAKIKTEDPESFNILIGQCDQMLGKTLKSDPEFLQQYQKMLKTMDKGKAVQFAKAKIDSVRAGVVQKVYKAFNRLGGGPKPVVQAPAAQTTNQPQIVRGAKPPAQDQIDWSRSKPGDVLDGKAFLKGRKEQYVWDA